MKTFLQEVAADLYARYGELLSERAILFPSRRARLFFIDALSQIVERPMWQPEWVTIDDLMTEISGLHTGDRVRLITELYKIYSEYHAEPFDKFYFWGEMLLNDFDTIDKYGVNADQLFRNISDTKELDADISYLTPRQLQIVKAVFDIPDINHHINLIRAVGNGILRLKHLGRRCGIPVWKPDDRTYSHSISHVLLGAFHITGGYTDRGRPVADGFVANPSDFLPCRRLREQGVVDHTQNFLTVHMHSSFSRLNLFRYCERNLHHFPEAGLPLLRREGFPGERAIGNGQ